MIFHILVILFTTLNGIVRLDRFGTFSATCKFTCKLNFLFFLIIGMNTKKLHLTFII